jgi:hypothetical protein
MGTYGTGVQERNIEGHTVRIDGANATISAKVPKETRHGSYEQEEAIYTNPADLLREGALPSFSLVRSAKAKNLIDGVYAAVEERVAERGHGLSREDFLETLEKLVRGDAKTYISASIQRETHGEPSMTTPQGFYDWNPGLREAYKQIKILARRPGFFVGQEDNSELNVRAIGEIDKVMRPSVPLMETYRTLTQLYSRLTGKPEEDVVALFPSAKLPDQEFFVELSDETQSDIPSGLGNALIDAVRKGRMSFVPDGDSGFYVRQMHEITPLVRRDTPEFGRYLVNDRYAKILDSEFVSQWAATRHTHVGHTDFSRMLIGSSGVSRKPIEIYPELRVEPFPTSYDRMAASLNFLEATVRLFLPEVLDRNRPLHDGSRSERCIGEELEDLGLILKGLGLISSDSIHLPYENGDARESVERALSWIEGAEDDPDLDRNTAVFVPIIRTTNGKRQISYINAGFKLVDVTASYKAKPNIKLSSRRGHMFTSEGYQFPVLVHREVRVPYKDLPNDNRLREILGADSFSEAELDNVVERLERG